MSVVLIVVNDIDYFVLLLLGYAYAFKSLSCSAVGLILSSDCLPFLQQLMDMQSRASGTKRLWGATPFHLQKYLAEFDGIVLGKG